ncbi:MAG: hypothetical protein ACRD5H_09955, partial [Nitrososphaerales archaeon]
PWDHRYADCGLNGGNSGKSFTPIIKTMIPMILTGNAENRNTPDLSLGQRGSDPDSPLSKALCLSKQFS